MKNRKGMLETMSYWSISGGCELPIASSSGVCLRGQSFFVYAFVCAVPVPCILLSAMCVYVSVAACYIWAVLPVLHPACEVLTMVVSTMMLMLILPTVTIASFGP